MADITEKTGNGELVTNRDQLVGVTIMEKGTTNGSITDYRHSHSARCARTQP